MSRSMTGYGISTANNAEASVTVEIRTVNNRFLDFDLKIPKVLFSYEQEIRDSIRNRVGRGRIAIRISEETKDTSNANVNWNIELAKNYVESLRSLMDNVGISEPISLQHLFTLGILNNDKTNDEHKAKVWKLTKIALNKALDELVAVSAREGAILLDDFRQRIASMKRDLENIKSLLPTQLERYRETLKQRIEPLFIDSRVDASRLELEIALIADKIDVTEEIVRLDSHFQLFLETLNRNDQIGKTLNFVLQEIGREVNTIASKSWAIEISQTVIRMKETLEQIREQVQNIE